ncbi:MAG TPA: glycosyltransferase family 39 protein [Polyangia bacterium]|nr:glycosyltransferase family 39 protein [Polyangia bacterium]
MTSALRRLGTLGRDRLVMALLALMTVTWLLAVEGRQGFGRDEGQYFRAGERYWGWFEELGHNIAAGHPGQSFTPQGLDRYWSDNAPDHPVVAKVLYGLSWRLFHRCTCTGPARYLHPIPVRGRHITLPLFKRDSTAFRFPAMLFAALLVSLVYRFCRRFVAPPAAVAGAVLTLAQPHYFFHAQIACFDAPITTMAFAVGYAYWKSLRSARWGVLTGVVFGVALGTKHNAWLMPIFLAGHYVWMRRGDLLGTDGRRRLPRVPLAFVSMVVIGPLVFLLHWPWLWQAPLLRTRAYVNRHLQHEHYNFEYLGRNWNAPVTDPSLKPLRMTAPFVETLFTVPVTTLALSLVGAVVLLRRRRGEAVGPDAEAETRPEETRASRPDWRRPGADVDRAPGAFLAVQIFGPLCVVALPATPIFGGVKHFMPAMPYIAVAAALGLDRLARVVRAALVAPRARGSGATRARVDAALPVALAALVCLPALVETRRSHPDGLSHYNLLAGGFAGGASLGMNRQFWGYSVLPMLPWVNGNPDKSAMYWHDVISDALFMYKREGRLGLDVGDTGYGLPAIDRSSVGILFYEKHWAGYEGEFWDAYGTTRPVYVREREGVPLIAAYQRGKR